MRKSKVSYISWVHYWVMYPTYININSYVDGVHIICIIPKDLKCDLLLYLVLYTRSGSVFSIIVDGLVTTEEITDGSISTTSDLTFGMNWEWFGDELGEHLGLFGDEFGMILEWFGHYVGPIFLYVFQSFFGKVFSDLSPPFLF